MSRQRLWWSTAARTASRTTALRCSALTHRRPVQGEGVHSAFLSSGGDRHVLYASWLAGLRHRADARGDVDDGGPSLSRAACWQERGKRRFASTSNGPSGCRVLDPVKQVELVTDDAILFVGTECPAVAQYLEQAQEQHTHQNRFTACGQRPANCTAERGTAIDITDLHWRN